ncbi:MAG: TetR/AcrR family transcriptional regulator [Spirosomataceae bacterium]
MFNTKQRIVEASVRLFNENGMDSVRLQQIAEEVGISVGNLAYHFKNKEAIIESVFEQVFEEFDTIFRQYLAQPNLADFDIQISQFYSFFSKNHFYLSEFFKGTVANTPYHQQWQHYVTKMMIQLRSRLQFLVMKGVLVPEPRAGHYEIIAEQIWMALVFFIPKCNMTGQPTDVANYRKNVWSLLFPYFTTQGQQEFSTGILPHFQW